MKGTVRFGLRRFGINRFENGSGFISVSGFRFRFSVSGRFPGYPAGIRYLASGPGPVFWLAGRLSGTRLPVPVRLSGWPAGYPVPGFRSRSGVPAGRLVPGARPIIKTKDSGPKTGQNNILSTYNSVRFLGLVRGTR